MAILHYVLALTNLFIFCTRFSYATDTLAQFQSLPYGRTLVSRDGSFELGFFSPGSSRNHYLGIWYKKIPVRTVVWVANRDKPIKDNSSMLSINIEGHLAILSQNHTVVWLANSRTKASSPIVQLLGSGNLVLRDEEDQNPQNYLWQSFDYPSDTLLPGMKFGWDLRTGLNRRIIAWKSSDDPSPGDFIWELVNHNNPEGIIWKGQTKYYRSGPWNGLRFSGAPELRNNMVFDFRFVSTKDEVYYMYNLRHESVISRIVMNQTIYVRERLTWIEEAKSWRPFSSVPRDDCDQYNLCGPFGNCVMGESPVCQCLKGFKPKSSRNWDAMDWTQGCIHSEPWICKVKNRDNFLKFGGIKLPDATNSWVDGTMTLEECKAKCLENCSCTAYGNSDISRGGSGCIIWFGDLNDIRQVSGAGQDLYIRSAVPETADREDADGKKIRVIVIPVAIFLALVMFFTLFFICKNQRKSEVEIQKTLPTEDNDEGAEDDMELPFYDLSVVASATNDFSTDNKLGEGGFGPVYKGILANGQEIAVKRLSQRSGQGLKEFKNEVVLCAKLQHRNLVKVLGCCIQGEEKMLIYEYMPNKSLDSFIFRSTAQSELLDWPKRYNIICGIARGILYLHQDSRLRIIHRDLKASNVLLDNELTPKISDFGMARIFGGDQVEGNTRRVAGTFGYMAPEYAFDGLFSVKSDVFSFGILVLEIVSGIKNRRLSLPNENINLIGHAWRLWKEEIPLELIDINLRHSVVESEALRCINIGLLCVQHHPDDRPDMASIVLMLSSEIALPWPKEPGFLMKNISVKATSSSGDLITCSTNELSITLPEAR
ncbi:G-type lectin S-receptor-like serine/threonine-protein kinase At4g27290 [Neltuma alba]|uniref:G-type lectin S-receptor-like serine/threonine-protein kinase At4g27290 n=1 Tax=Neltuma alba TaxID=207710 RepID=UPI0010A39A2D|nr:G-type lectin S-receptor-like serine/threonine-protein kinase At4g27290 [Prosopis alba]XP_028800248.1 G-type lectin S-receptor-like serine/threonine-protein kinase At4g27290 [Prosopis alba]